MALKSRIEKALKSIKHPKTGEDIIASGAVQAVSVKGDSVSIVLTIDPSDAEIMEPVRKACEDAAKAVRGIKDAHAVMTAQNKPSGAGNSAPPPQSQKPQEHSHPAPPTPDAIPGVRHIIAVASGKGGVGKSTTSVNLAYALQKLGLKTGLVDLDIYGPSGAKLLGIDERPEFTDDDQIKPMFKHGLAASSMGALLDPDKAAIWRGPMVIKAVQQLLGGVAWDIDGEIDVLVADLPPGTGDVQLTLAQTAIVAGAIIVSTPQDIALIDARKAYDMFEKTGTTVLGMIENMSYFQCPKCGERTDIFGHGGAEETAKEKGIPFLGAIPLHMDIRTTSDAGTPIVLAQPDSDHAKAYLEIARSIAGALKLAG